MSRGDFATAAQALSNVSARERVDADLILARIHLESGRFNEARAICTRLSRGASRADALTIEGEILERLGQYDEALSRWTSVLSERRPSIARRARSRAAALHARLGHSDLAREIAQPLVDEYNDAQQEAEANPGTPARPNPRTAILRDAEALTFLASAMRSMGFVQDANDAYNQATQIDGRRIETLVGQAELFLSKEDTGHAGESLREALALAPHHAGALLLRAQTRLANDLDFVKAGEDLTAALAANSQLHEVYAVRAQMLLRDEDLAGAEAQVQRALAINPRSLEALSTRAAIRFMASDEAGVTRALDAVFAISPVYVQAYALLADFAEWSHRYDEAAVLLRRGLERPAISQDRRLQGWMRAQLGMNLLRTGDEEAALPELTESFRVDRYNVRVYNLLNFYEDIVANQYTSERTGPFTIRLHNDDRAVMRRYVGPMLQRAYDDMVRRYGFTPRGPLHIEMYSDTEHFSVRTAGLPEIGVQGVCFGRVITAISPRAASFNWSQILWHELAHVFAIQRSRSRVPRWFTEGLSEWESFHSHPEWAREMDGELFHGMQAGRVPRVADMNTAFTHARSGEDMLVAYYAASKLVEFMIDQFTFARVAALLPLWGEGLATPVVIQRGLGITADELDQRFRQHTTTRLRQFASQFHFDASAYRDRAPLDQRAAAPGATAQDVARAAAAAIVAGESREAMPLLERALTMDPAQPLALYLRTRLALAERDAPRALLSLDSLLRAHDGYELRHLEWVAALAARNETRARTALDAAIRLDPTQSEPWAALVTLHERAGRAPELLAALRQVVRLDQHDRESLRKLFGKLSAASLWADIRALAEHARGVDPLHAATHLALGQAFAQGAARADATLAFETALALEPTAVQRAEACVGLARLLLQAGDRRGAEARVREALRTQPTSADALAVARQLGIRLP
ncbi:MAG: tetratricopeptide repeat protein [Deltaproteobacteria bacterium]|nr:tetratricopeptide repeat protein [Deltaproteobacteria bacterium]